MHNKVSDSLSSCMYMYDSLLSDIYNYNVDVGEA